MNQPLDQVSQSIGALQAEIRLHREHSEAGHQAISRRLDGMAEQLDELAVIPEKLKRIEPLAEDYGRMKQRGIGILIVLSAVAGAAGSIIRDLVRVVHG